MKQRLPLSRTARGIRTAADAVSPSLVAIARGGRGSGLVLAQDQVLVGAAAIRAERLELELADGRRADATVTGLDPDRGLAVLAAATGDAPPFAWPEADAVVELGTPVVAVARPAGHALHAALGYVAAVGERVRGARGRLGDPGLVHTAPLPRGTGGSPLVALDGTLVGLNVARLDGGFLLALPATAALRSRLDELAAGGVPAPRALGAAIAPPRAARRLRRSVGLPERDGLLVQEVAEGSAAAAAGLARGDLIVAAGGASLDGVDALLAAIDARQDRLDLRVVRGVDERDVAVVWDG